MKAEKCSTTALSCDSNTSLFSEHQFSPSSSCSLHCVPDQRHHVDMCSRGQSWEKHTLLVLVSRAPSHLSIVGSTNVSNYVFWRQPMEPCLSHIYSQARLLCSLQSWGVLGSLPSDRDFFLQIICKPPQGSRNYVLRKFLTGWRMSCHSVVFVASMTLGKEGACVIW